MLPFTVSSSPKVAYKIKNKNLAQINKNRLKHPTPKIKTIKQS